MSDTPETDAQLGYNLRVYGKHVVSPDFARKLERERDELKSRLEAWRFHADAWGTDPDAVRSHIKSIERERNELHAEVEKLSQSVCDECDGSGWKENRVEGRHVCVCIEESEPYNLLKQEVEQLKADKVRLDWLEDKPVYIENFTRAAIDAAMK